MRARILALIFFGVTVMSCGETSRREQGDSGLNDAGEIELLDAGGEPFDAGGESFDAGVVDAGSVDAGACTLPVITLTHVAASPSAATVHKLSKAVHPLAVCNDNSPASFLFRPGVGSGVNRWVVYLEGGGSCGNAVDCQARWQNTPNYMTSKNISEGEIVTGLEGIKSTDPLENPDFYDANLVQIAYCSSDVWSGDTAGDDSLMSDRIGRWHFRGRRIVEAVFQDLNALGLSSATEVILMGSSAGGIGVSAHADNVATRVPSAARYVALSDASFFMNYPTYDTTTKRESTQMPTDRELYLAESISAWGGWGDSSCEAAATNDEQRALCRSPVDLLTSGAISTPYFVRQSQLDGVQLKQFITVKDGFNGPATAFRQRFAAAMRTKLGQVAPHVSVYSTFDTHHGVINETAEWSSQRIDATTLQQAIGAWYRNPCGEDLALVQLP